MAASPLQLTNKCHPFLYYQKRNNLAFQFLKPVMIIIMGESSQNKSQLHTRQTMERNYSLRLFGIKIDDMPIIFTGKPNLKMHTKFIKFQQAKEKLY